MLLCDFLLHEFQLAIDKLQSGKHIYYFKPDPLRKFNILVKLTM